MPRSNCASTERGMCPSAASMLARAARHSPTWFRPMPSRRRNS
ncbi:hypothetical protein [Halomonas halophila]